MIDVPSSHLNTREWGFNSRYFSETQVSCAGYVPSAIKIKTQSIALLSEVIVFWCSRNTTPRQLPHLSPSSSYNDMALNKTWDILTWESCRDGVITWKGFTRYCPNHRLFPSQKSSYADLRCFRWSLAEQKIQSSFRWFLYDMTHMWRARNISHNCKLEFISGSTVMCF